MYWVYDIPTWLFGVLTIVFVVGLSWLGVILVRPSTSRRILNIRQDGGEAVTMAVEICGGMLALVLGLIAFAAYDSYNSISSTVDEEATKMAALYRDVSAYPSPTKETLTGQLKTYTRYVMSVEWPEQQRGVIPMGGVLLMNAFQKDLTLFEPQTPGKEALHAEALRAYNNYIELRRQRISSVDTSLPGVLWWVLIGASAVVIGMTWLLPVKRLGAHLLVSGALASFLGVMVFLIAAMDNPFRGDELSVSPSALRVIYDSLMK